jgi:photosystem II reaction center protein PsbP
MMRTIAVIGLACVTIACTKHEPVQPKKYVDAKRGVQFDYPSDWIAEDVPEQNVLLVSSPIQEANWQTNVFIELRRDLDASQSPEQRLSTLADNLKRTKAGFALQSSRAFTHASGVPAGELIYTHDSQGVPLTEREVILWLEPGKALFVTGSAVTSLWSKYEPQMNVIFDSIRRGP